MIGNQIKKRPIAFVSWFLTIILFISTAFSLVFAFDYWNATTQLRFRLFNARIGVVSVKLLHPRIYRNNQIRKHELQFTPSQWFDLPTATDLPFIKATGYELPLGIPLAVLFPLTSYLFWRRLGPPMDFCECGYNLQGNISGICPECGKTTVLKIGQEENHSS